MTDSWVRPSRRVRGRGEFGATGVAGTGLEVVGIDGRDRRESPPGRSSERLAKGGRRPEEPGGYLAVAIPDGDRREPLEREAEQARIAASPRDVEGTIKMFRGFDVVRREAQMPGPGSPHSAPPSRRCR